MSLFERTGKLFKRILDRVRVSKLSTRATSTTEARLARLAEQARRPKPARKTVVDVPTGEVITTPGNDEEAFLYFRQVIYVQSSNVVSIKYHIDQEFLVIEYKDGSFYSYAPVPLAMAMSLWRASSKGKWVWDQLRVRGTVYGFKVPYTMVFFAGRAGWAGVKGMRGRRIPGGRRTGGIAAPGDVKLTALQQRAVDKLRRKELATGTYKKPPPI